MGGVNRRSCAALCLLLAACGSPPAARIDAVAPPLFCDAAGDGIVTVSGVGLGPVVVDVLGVPTLVGPSFRLDPVSGLALDSALEDGAASRTLPPERVRWIDDTTAELVLDAGAGFEPGAWQVVAVTPEGVAAKGGVVLIAGPPIIDDLDPSGVCHDVDEATFTVIGRGFLAVDGVGPTVTVGGEAAISVTPGDCLPLAGDVGGEVCGSLEVTFGPGPLPLGEADVVVTNPEPAACASEEPAALAITRPPEITAVEPDWLCDSGGTLTIEGTDFGEDATVDLGDVEVVSVTWIDSGHLEVEIGDGPSGPVDVTVSDGSGCSATFEDAFTLVSAPLVYAVDPPAAPNDVAMVVTARVANVVGEITDAWLVAPDGTELATTWSWDAATPGQVQVAVPAGLDEGAWTVGVAEEGICEGRSAGTLSLTASPTLSVTAVDPGYAWTYDATPVEVQGAGFGDPAQVFFVSEAGEVARGGAVARRDDAHVRVVVPTLLAEGPWDVLVVNPDGAIGWLDDGITVTTAAPPTITSVAPAHLEKSSEQPLVVLGQDFVDPTVSLLCREGGVDTAVPIVVDAWEYGRIDATVPVTGFDGAVCTVTVQNADGVTATWSALSITNPSQNLFPWQAGPSLSTARRAPAAAAGRTTSVNRFVYAVGGDAGDASTAMTSVEVAPVGLYGDLDAWSTLPRSLPEARTLAAALTVGRFVYLVGGDDGAGATDGVLRALILDPMDVPWFDDPTVDEDEDGQGLPPGTYTWRVSALFDPTDSANPGGESLATDLLVLTLPDTGATWLPTLSWSAVDGAVGYRVYRDDAWLADVVDPTYTDVGDPTDPGAVPLGDGALGEWATMPSLTTPRASPCVALAYDPTPDPVTAYLIAAGGFDASGDPLASIEVLDVVVEAEDRHTPGAWTPSATELSDARGQCGAWTVDSTLHDVVGDDETWVYFGGGLDDRRATGTVDAGLLGLGGRLDEWQEVDSMSPARAGFGVASASGFLYAFGGQNGSPSAGGVSGELDAATIPEVENWNSLGTSLSEARYLPGSAQESAVIVVIGGQTDGADATSTVDWTNF